MERPKVRVSALILLVPTLLLATDVGLRHAAMAEWSAPRWVAYALAVGLDFLCYGLAFALTRHVWKRSPRAALGLVALGAFALSVWVVSAFVYYGVFRAYPSWADLVFISEEGGHVEETWSLVSGFVDRRVILGMLGMTTLVASVWVFTLQRIATVPAQRRASLTVALCLAVALGPRVAMSDSVATSPSASLPISSAQLLRYYLMRTRGALHAAERETVPPLASSTQPRPNVLILLQESLARDRMSLYGYERPTTPRLDAWFRAHAGSEVLFENATANASNTSISVVTLLTGLPPDASTELVHAQPFAWQYARAAGYRTFLRSAQSFRYANFDEYFLSVPPDDTWTAEPGLVPMANGGGMDDELLIPRAREAIERARQSGKPFFGVVQFNNTHFPYLMKPDRPNRFGTDRLGRYENAVSLLDGVIVDLLDWLEANHYLDDTLVVLTSDHGESHDGHEPHRTQSYYEDVTGIPLWIHVPRSLMTTRPEAMTALRANQARRVQNLDLLPTALDAMGVLHDPALERFVGRFAGQSLLAPVDPERPVLIVNNNAIRTWVNEGFGIAVAKHKYVFSERYGEALFDLSSDPGELHNLWDPQHRPAWIDATLRRHPDLCALRTRHCRPATGCVAIACGGRQ